MASRNNSQLTSAQRAGRPLARYRSMRNFGVTAEPRGGRKAGKPLARSKALPFVIQKHAATHLHYDFRLGWDGVLKSWAVAKGPSYYPGDKRLAVMVEDHPWEYRNFEGTIPKGQYGGGAVMVWDQGEWLPHGDVDRGLNDGHLKFELRGKKLKGSWALIRMNGRAGGNSQSGKTNWLLIKEKDEYARGKSEPAVIEEAQNSAVSGRTIEEISAANGRVWSPHSKHAGPARTKPEIGQPPAPSVRSQHKHSKEDAKVDIGQTPLERSPGFIAPQLAQQVMEAPNGSEWMHELKLDGYRIQIHIYKRGQKGKKERAVKLLTRKAQDWTSRMPEIAEAARKLNVESAILDGEAVALDEHGVSNFADLQAALYEGRQKYITYFAFDLLHLNGRNLRGFALRDRAKILNGLLTHAADSPLRLSDAIHGDGPVVFERACSLGAEGIVSKLSSAPYVSGRTNTWLKVKCRLEQEFVIGGFTLPSKGTRGVGALLLGFYDGGDLRYAGRTGTGFTQAMHLALRKKLDAMARQHSPFAPFPAALQHGAHWVKPELVAQIAFATWTRDDRVRQAAFKGLREDKPANEVKREGSMPSSQRRPTLKESRVKTPQHSEKADSKKSACLPITHPDKVLDTESGLTKKDLAEYYIAVAEHLLPYIAERPLSVVRCPDGNGKPCFFQKHAGFGLPNGVKSVAIRNRKSGQKEDFLTVNSSDGLVGLAQMGVLEIHPWGSHNRSLEKPDRIVFDLDPDAAIEWKTLADAAREVRKKLSKAGLKSFLKSTGGKGLHVVAPIRPEHQWAVIKEFAHRLVLDMERTKPELYVTTMTKATRKNHIYLDYLRNDREATSIAPFSPRARPGAPVAMPLQWTELNLANAPAFSVPDFSQWKKRLRRDPWAQIQHIDQELRPLMVQSSR